MTSDTEIPQTMYQVQKPVCASASRIIRYHKYSSLALLVHVLRNIRDDV